MSFVWSLVGVGNFIAVVDFFHVSQSVEKWAVCKRNQTVIFQDKLLDRFSLNLWGSLVLLLSVVSVPAEYAIFKYLDFHFVQRSWF